MSNTYAINTTRGQEFTVEREMWALGLHPWVPRRLDVRYIKEKRDTVWYDRPYVPKLMFSVIPAISWPDVVKLKHVIGKPFPLSDLDIKGTPAQVITRKDGSKVSVPAVPGLNDFKAAVEAEWNDAERRKKNGEYECLYVPGQALEILDGPFEGFRAEFKKTIQHAHDEYARLKVAVDIFGRETPVEVDPDKVKIL